MTQKEFLELLHHEHNRIKLLYERKAADYAREDIFFNFTQAAEVLQSTPEQVWAAYFTKHYLALMNWASGRELDESPVDRIRDMIVYLFLLLGMIKEKEEK